MRFGFRELIFLLLLIGMPVAAYFVIFQPRNEQIAAARVQIKQKQVKLAQLEAATANMKDLGREIDNLKRAITVFEQKLPAQREEQVILKEVTELAATHHLTIKSVRTDKTIESAHYAELPIKMVIVGNFDGFYSFLLDLEKLPRITHLPTMTLKKVRRTNDGEMEADMVLSIFFEGKTPGNESHV